MDYGASDEAANCFKLFQLKVGVLSVTVVARFPVIPLHFDFAVLLKNGAKLVSALPGTSSANALDRQANRPQDRGLTTNSRRLRCPTGYTAQQSFERLLLVFCGAGADSATPYCGSLRRNAREVGTWRCFWEFSGAKKKGQAPL
jgi:hypothetical protein